jgi:hypothetical protein
MFGPVTLATLSICPHPKILNAVQLSEKYLVGPPMSVSSFRNTPSCWLFNNNCSVTYISYIASKEMWMISWKRRGKIGRGLIYGTIQVSAWSDRGKPRKLSVKAAVLGPKIWTRDLPNAKQKIYFRGRDNDKVVCTYSATVNDLLLKVAGIIFFTWIRCR